MQTPHESAPADARDQLRRRRAFFFDRDGTLSLDDEAIPGAREFLDALRARGAACFVMTNNSSRTPAEHHRRLAGLGLGFAAEDVLVSSQPAIAHLLDEGMRRVFWLATEAVGSQLEEAGLVYDDREPDALLLTYDTELTYDKLRDFSNALRRGTPYFATHLDQVCPTPTGPIPDVGTFLHMFEVATGRLPERTFGKPEPAMLDVALRRLGLARSDAVMVGDRLYTDIALTAGTDALSVLVLTGESTAEDHDRSEHRADVVATDLFELLPYVTD